MNTKEFTIEGALGIKAGLNRDSLSVDLRTIPGYALTVVFKGDNGSGKSTIFNLAMTPWREPPQLPGNVYDHFGPTGRREMIWTHAGETYRTIIEYKQTQRMKGQKAYLHVNLDGEWEPVRLPNNTVSDGKSRTYDECLESILGPKDIYFLSAFRAQGAGTIADYENPKDMMRSLLNLDEPARLGKGAKEVSKLLRREYETIRGRIDRLDGHADEIAGFEADIDRIDGLAAGLGRGKADAEYAVSRARADLDKVVAEGADDARIAEQRDAVNLRLAGAIGAASNRKQDAEYFIGGVRARTAKAEQDANQRSSALQADLFRAEKRASDAQQLLDNRDEIEAAVQEIADLRKRIRAEDASRDEVLEQLADLEIISARVGQLSAQTDHRQSAVMSASHECEQLKVRAGFVDKVPCGGKFPYDNCPALKESMSAKLSIPQAQDSLAAKIDEAREASDEIATLRKQIVELPDMHARAQHIQQLIGNLEDRIESIRGVAEQRSAIEHAEVALSQASDDVKCLHARLILHGRESEASAVISQNEITRVESAYALEAARSKATIAAIKAELADLPEPGTGQAIEIARRKLADAEMVNANADDATQTARAARADYVASIARLTDELAKSAADREQSESLAQEIAQWNLLAAGLAGVIDLTIEDAGPSIASIANRLLTEAYGPRFSVRIVTQREQQNGKLVEDFDISVVDGETDKEAPLSMKSGGQCVWIDKALRDAVGIFQQESVGIHYEALFSDEAEDGLTEERKAQYYRMDRVALDMGGYVRKFTISHNPAAWEEADYVIDVDALRVEVPA